MSAPPPPAFPISHNSGEIDSPSIPSDSDIESLLSLHSEAEFLPINDRRKVWLDVRRNWKSDAKKISRGLVYLFVLHIEKQFQSIKYTQYLARHLKIIKHDANLDDIFNTLVESHRQHDILGKFDKQVIWDCVKGYELDLNPVVELQKIKMSDPVSYYDYFLFWQTHKKDSFDRSGLVRVDNVSLDTSERTIFKFFWSCGTIHSVEMTSGGKSQIAFVTFSHSSGADKALLLKDNLIDNQPVKITSISVYKPGAAGDDDDVDYDYNDEDEDEDGNGVSDWDYDKDEKYYVEALILLKKFGLNPPGAAPVQEDACRVHNVLNKYWYYTRSQSMDEIC